VSARPTPEPSALERSERLVAELEDATKRIARLAVAYAQELAEDIWAEARSVHKSSPER
jgi:hypothetical protein